MRAKVREREKRGEAGRSRLKKIEKVKLKKESINEKRKQTYETYKEVVLE